MEGHTEEAEADNNSKEDRIQQIEESNVNVGADKDLNRDKSVKIEESNVNETPKDDEHGLQKAIPAEKDLGQDKEEVQQIEESNVNVDDEADKDINQSKSVKIEESNVNETPKNAEHELQKAIPAEKDLGQDKALLCITYVKEDVQQIEESNVADKDLNHDKSVKIEESNVNEAPRDAEQGLLQKVIPAETAEQELNQGNVVEIEDGKRSEASKCSKLQSLIFGSLQKFFKAQVRWSLSTPLVFFFMCKEITMILRGSLWAATPSSSSYSP